MKKHILPGIFILLMCAMIPAKAQFTVYKFSKSEFNKNIEQLKKRTLIFVVTDKYLEYLDHFELALEQSWDISPYKVITYDEIENYTDKDKYSFADLWGFYSVGDGFSAGVRLELFYFNTGLPEKKQKTNLATIFFYPTFESLKNMIGQKSDEYLYKMVDYYNYSPGFIQLYMKTINDMLLAKKVVKTWKSDMRNVPEMTNVKNDTLYIPDYVLVNFNALTGAENKRFDEENIVRQYDYPTQFMRMDDLSVMILNKEIDYVLCYTKWISEKFVNVYNVKTGEMIYLKNKRISYEFRADDLGDMK